MEVKSQSHFDVSKQKLKHKRERENGRVTHRDRDRQPHRIIARKLKDIQTILRMDLVSPHCSSFFFFFACSSSSQVLIVLYLSHMIYDSKINIINHNGVFIYSKSRKLFLSKSIR